MPLTINKRQTTYSNKRHFKFEIFNLACDENKAMVAGEAGV
jgi:hypothetical protein